jgi:two-component system, sensor histidine kinase and response regulator
MSGTASSRILIVDDEPALVTALCRTLETQGYSTFGAASGRLALDLLRGAAADSATRIEVLITDLKMPAMDGLTLLRQAHAIDADLVSIVMTGHGTIDTAVEALKSGALDYLLKPFNLSVAMPVLSRALAVRKLRVENAALLRQVAHRTVELEESNRQLQAANRDLDAYNASVSHDIRGHLNRVIGFSELLSAEQTGPLNPRQKEFLDYISQGAVQLLRLTDDLLRFARLAQQPLRKEPVAVRALVGEIFAELRQGAPGSNVELQLGPLPDAFADPPLLRQVFVNLISNAIKFSSRTPHPLVSVAGAIQGGACTYSVRDNGVGFDMLQADQLFDMFHRLHNAAEFDGTGIGLSIVRRILERHGGSISVEAAVGAGANFKLSLPDNGLRTSSPG